MRDEEKAPEDDRATDEELHDVVGGAGAVQGRMLQGKTYQGAVLQGRSLQGTTIERSSLEAATCVHGKPLALCEICGGTASSDP